MDGKKSSFWPSYVDIMTTLFAVMLVLFVVSYSRFKSKEQDLKDLVNEYENIITVYSTVSSIDSTEYFGYNKQYLKHLFTIDVEYEDKEYQIDKLKLDKKGLIAEANNKRDSILSAGNLIKKTILRLEEDPLVNSGDNNIKFLVIIEGQSSRIKFHENDWKNNFTLSYLRAKFLNEFWQKNGIDLSAIPRCELIISGSGEGGVPRYNPDSMITQNNYSSNKDYYKAWEDIERRNQRFLIHIVPVIGNIDVTKAKINQLKGNKKK